MEISIEVETLNVIQKTGFENLFLALGEPRDTLHASFYTCFAVEEI
jgi:hypothetical protein